SRRGRRDGVLVRPDLRSDAEDGVDELALRYSIALRDPADLIFADCMHRLVTLDRSPRSFSRTEAEARRNPLLDEAMVLLDDVYSDKARSDSDSAGRVHRSASTQPSRWHMPDGRPR